MAIASTPGSATSRRLGYLFKHIERLMAQLNAEALAPLSIDAKELGVLLVIDSFEPASQQQVAARIGVDRTTMVTLLDTLETKGIITRHPDTNDRRRNVVELTKGGEDLMRRAIAASNTAELGLLAPLSHAEGEQLRELLARILARSPA